MECGGFVRSQKALYVSLPSSLEIRDSLLSINFVGAHSFKHTHPDTVSDLQISSILGIRSTVDTTRINNEFLTPSKPKLVNF